MQGKRRAEVHMIVALLAGQDARRRFAVLTFLANTIEMLVVLDASS